MIVDLRKTKVKTSGSEGEIPDNAIDPCMLEEVKG